MKAKLLTTALVLLGCIEAYAVSPPPPSYSLTDIGVLPGFTGTRGSSINVLGQVAGYCYTNSPNGTFSQHAFVYREGKLIDFGSLYNPDIRTIATFVNIQGEVTLSYFMPVPPVYFNEYSILYRNGRFAKLPNGGSEP
jgi:probable HAF family extracellular repeat protein